MAALAMQESYKFFAISVFGETFYCSAVHFCNSISIIPVSTLSKVAYISEIHRKRRGSFRFLNKFLLFALLSSAEFGIRSTLKKKKTTWTQASQVCLIFVD